MTYNRACLNCGNSFTTLNSIQLYCCDKCGNKFRSKKHYKNNSEYYTAKREYRRLHQTEKGILSRIKSRAKRQNIPFNLNVEDIIIPKICPVLGIDILIGFGHKGNFPNSPSVDRINPKLGYVKGNIRVISQRANLLKSNAKVEELEKVLWDLRRIS